MTALASSADKAESKENQPSNWKLFARLFAFGWRYRTETLLVIALQLALTATTLAGLAAIGLGIDIARGAADPKSPAPHFPLGWRPGPEWTPWQLLLLTAGCVLLFALLRGVLSYKHAVASSKLIHRRIIAGLRAAVYDRLQRLSFHFFDAHDSGSVINRVTADVQGVRQFVEGVVLQLFVVLISLGFYLAYMLSIHVWLTLACLATTPVLWIATVWFSRIVRPGYDKNRELVDQMIQRLTENVQGVQVVKGFALEDSEQAKFRAASVAVLEQQRWLCMRNSIYTPAVSFLTQVNLTVLLVYGGWLSINGELPIGTGLVVFAGLLQQFSSQVTNVASIANSVQQSLTGARRVFEILDAPIEIQSPPDAVKLEKAVGSVKFENVCFSYHKDKGPVVLSHVDFEVRPGQCIAILGATGAGKSTLLSLVPRFHDPVHGRVLVDGHDVKSIDLDDLRRNVGVVFQESFLFSNTIWANIAFGSPNATREQVEKAAKIAAAHDFIMELPNGYDSVLGEAGIDLSGGQRQRLALARALVLEPSILLLDDPTAAIDPSTEEEILAAMESSMRGRTTFVVAHRLSTLRRADLVLVLDRGKIVQYGSHQELMQQDGLYRKAALHQTGLLDDLQASNYWTSDPQPS